MMPLYVGLALCAVVPTLLLLNRHYMHRLVERRITTYQNDLVAQHCAEVENIYRQMRGWRHDYHNHIQVMKAYHAFGQSGELGGYLDKLDADLVSVDRVLKTGNVMVDAILNSKLSLARAKDISVNAKAFVPETLTVQNIDLCVMIGNLLDNAIEACARLPDKEDRFIRVYIGKHKELFYISITNAVGGGVKKQGLRYLTTKRQANHGFGLVRIDKIIEKYSGFVDRQHELGVFATEIMLPL